MGADQAGPLLSFLGSLSQSTVVLDLDGCELLDSAGLTALLDSQDKLRSALGDLKIATNNPANKKILEITRLDQQLEVFDSVIDAVKSFRP
jgi:anti-anti-sigma factor